MTVYQYPDYLAHHGVKGMKWGVRKKTQGSVKTSKSTKKSSSKSSGNKALKTGVKVAVGVGVAVAAAYGAHKLGNVIIEAERTKATEYGKSYAQGLLAAGVSRDEILKMANSPDLKLPTHLR